MKYFLHDTNSFQDEKITMLFMEHGYEGVGLFYTLLEKIGMQEKPVRTDVLKRQLRVGKKLEKCWSFMEEIGVISSNNGETFNERILSYSETYQIKKEKTREKVSQWREKQEVAKSVTSYVPVSNLPKVKESKVNESKEDIVVGEPTPTENLKEKQDKLLDRDKVFYGTLVPFVVVYGKETIRAFYNYWKEPNKSKTKMKFEMEPTWDLNSRLTRWEANNSKFKGNKKSIPDQEAELLKSIGL